jgi:tripartite ATP-independent transporter DctM subunit
LDPLHAALLLGLFLVLLALGIPISVGIAITSLSGLCLSVEPGPAATTLAQRMATGLDRFTLLAIPFFILSGQLMNRGGIARRLVDLARALVGMLPGGLAYVNIVSGMLFGAISGSAAAAVAAVGSFMLPRMDRQGYDRDFASAVNIASATNSLVIPPSNILIVYSLASGGVSIAALFVAGYLPGLLIGAALMLVAGRIAQRRGYPVDERVPLGQAARRLLDAIPSLFLVVLVIGGIVAGIFTATEAGAIAVFYSFVLSVLVYREVAWRELPELLVAAAATTSIVMLLIATSMAFSWVIAYERIPEAVTAALLGVEGGRVATLLIINLILLLAGTVLDMTPAVLIFTPMLLPVAEGLGVGPVHFGIIMVMNLCIGLCTPPVGSVLFLGCSVAGTSITATSRALVPLYLGMIATLLVVTFLGGHWMGG